jgi:ABC-type transport system involved in cytochrome c biogenesis permease subunit
MRDLEKQISDWRRSMAKASKERPEALDELETHLREEIDRLVRAGTSADQAFDLAMSRLGTPAALGAEFDKLAQMRRAKWKPATLAQWACLAIPVFVLLWLVPRIGDGRMTLLLASHVLSVSIGYVTMFIIGGLAICYVFADWLQRTGPSQRYALHRAIIQLATISAVLTTIGTVLGMIWTKQNWGRYWAWDPKESGAAIVLLCALVTMAFARFKPASCRALVLMAITGNIGTAWGWFGANAEGTFPLLTAFIASQCLILLAFSATALRRSERAEW